MKLFIRLFLYGFAGWLAAMGYVNMDQEAGTITIDLDLIVDFASAAGVMIGTFVWSRFEKKRGGLT